MKLLAAHVDLAKVQMFFFTLVAFAYIAALWSVMSAEKLYDAQFSFPALSNGFGSPSRN